MTYDFMLNMPRHQHRLLTTEMDLLDIRYTNASSECLASVVKGQVCHVFVALASLHCKKEKVVLTEFGHLSCTQNCCKSLGKV